MVKDDVAEDIERAMSRLVYLWRGADSRGDKIAIDELVNRYLDLLRFLMKWDRIDGIDDPYCLLPDELLPEEYIRLRDKK